MIQLCRAAIASSQLIQGTTSMVKLKATGVTLDMLRFMFYQDALDDHPDFEARFADVYANGGYKRADKLKMAAFMEDAISSKYSDQDLEDMFETASCEWATPLGGHRELLFIMLTELRRHL